MNGRVPDYMSVVINAAGRDGRVGHGPKVILKYIQAKPGDYVCAKSGKKPFFVCAIEQCIKKQWMSSPDAVLSH